MSTGDLRTVLATRGHAVVRGVSDVDEVDELFVSSGLRSVEVVPLSRDRVVDAHVSVVPQTHSLSFVRATFGAEVAIRSRDGHDGHVVFAVTVAGSARFRCGRAQLTVTPGTAGFVPPREDFQSIASADLDQVLIPVARPHLQRMAAHLLDSSDCDALAFDHEADVVRLDREVTEVLVATAMLSTADADAPVEFSTSRLRRRMEDVAIEAMLMTMPSFRSRIPAHGSARSRSVAAAMDYMIAHLGEPTTLSMVALHALVSPRALQLAFRAETGTTPMRWLRSRRLEHARRLLLGGDAPPLPVTMAAYESGFVHPSYFAGRYAERFGESPRDTRRRALRGARD